MDGVVTQPQAAIQVVSRRVRELFPSALALILTGSTARGEQSIMDRSGVVRWLSDMEFLVVVADVESFAQRRRELAAVTSRINDELHASQCDAVVELTPAPERYFRKLTPHLFSYELRLHGRQLFGAHPYLGDIPIFDSSSIPLEDDWRLLSNRMVEWLDHLTTPESEPELECYLLSKQYADLVTSLSLFSGCYAPSYRERAAQLPHLQRYTADSALQAMLDRCRFFENALIATDFKLSPRPMDRLTPTWLEMRDVLPDLLTQVWCWELEQLSSCRVVNPTQALPAALRVYGPYARLRGWGRLWVGLSPYQRLSSTLRHLLLFSKGSPRSLVYTCAAVLLSTFLSRQQEDLEWAGRHLPVPAPDLSWSSLTAQCIWHWKRILRMTRA